MNLLLSISLFVILFISIIASKYTLYHPAVLFSAVWAISSFFYLLLAKEWGQICSWKNCLFILSSNAWCVLCMLFSSHLGVKKKKNEGYLVGMSVAICKHKIILTVFYITATIILLRRINELANVASVYTSSTNLLYLARIAEINGTGYGQLNVNLMRINIAIGILVAEETIKELFMRKKVHFFNYIILIYAVIFSVLRGSRNDMMYLLGAYLFILLYHSYKRCANKREACKRTFKILCIFFLVISIVWAVSGIIFDRSGESAVKSILGYVGCPLGGLNYLLDHPGFIRGQFFGEHTFDSIYAMLIRFGLFDAFHRTVYLPYIHTSTFSINVYSMYGRFVADFGIFGSLFMTTVFGLFYGFLYARLRDSRNPEKERATVILNSVFMYPLLMSFFEEKLFSYINSTMFVLIFIFLINWIMKKQSKSRKLIPGKAKGANI